MRLKSIVVTIFGALACASALADTVEVLLDVELTSRTVYSGQVANVMPLPPAQYIPLSIVFSDEGAIITQPPASDPLNHPTGLFPAVMRDIGLPSFLSVATELPTPNVPPSSKYGGISYERYALDEVAEGLPQSIGVSVVASSSAEWQTLGFQSSSIAYSRGLFFGWWSDELATANLQAWSGAEFAAYLQSLAGISFSDAYFADYQRTVRYGVYVDGQWVPSTDAGDVISQVHESVTGNVTIQFVTVVPEPAVGLLMGIGLLGVSLAARRNRLQ